MKRDDLDLKLIIKGLELALHYYGCSGIGYDLAKELMKIEDIQDE